MEKELVEKKLARLEGARGAEIADLQAELESLRGSAKEQLKEKEGRINSLVEELSKTQSLLSEKETELEGVSRGPMPDTSPTLLHLLGHAVACDYSHMRQIQSGSSSRTDTDV